MRWGCSFLKLSHNAALNICKSHPHVCTLMINRNHTSTLRGTHEKIWYSCITNTSAVICSYSPLLRWKGHKSCKSGRRSGTWTFWLKWLYGYCWIKVGRVGKCFGRNIDSFLNMCVTKPRIDSQIIRAAKCHVWWIMLPMPGFFTCTAGLTVDGVFQCHPRSVVVRYEKRLCEGQSGHLSTLTFHAKTFRSPWTLNPTSSSFFFFAKRTKKNAAEGFKSQSLSLEEVHFLNSMAMK